MFGTLQKYPALLAPRIGPGEARLHERSAERHQALDIGEMHELRRRAARRATIRPALETLIGNFPTAPTVRFDAGQGVAGACAVFSLTAV
jgi:hypothetical protein